MSASHSQPSSSDQTNKHWCASEKIQNDLSNVICSDGVKCDIVVISKYMVHEIRNSFLKTLNTKKVRQYKNRMKLKFKLHYLIIGMLGDRLVHTEQ